MKRFFGMAMISVVALGCSTESKLQKAAPPIATQFKSAAEMPVELFFKNPSVFGYRISPDGKTLAFLQSWKNRLNVFVRPVDDPSKIRQITFVEDRDLHSVDWKGPEHILFSKDIGGDENDHVFVVNISNGQLKDLTPFPKVRANVMDLLEEASESEVLVAHNQRDKEVFDVYRVNVLTGESRLVAKNDLKITEWLADHNGDPRAAISTDGVNSIFYYRRSLTSPWVPVLKTNFRTEFSPVAFTSDNQHIFAITNLGVDKKQLIEIDPTQPSSKFTVKVLKSHPKYDLQTALYSDVRKNIGRVQVVTDRLETVFLNAQDQSDWDSLKAKFPGASLIFANDSKDESWWVIKTERDVSRGSYYLYHRTSRQLLALGEVSPWIAPNLMSEMKTINYKTRDGLNIQGFLTLPKGKDPKNLPVVINPHGGPWARDAWRFNPESQFLASRGYAVLQMNYRGSTGYGRKFWVSSFKQWGRKMQDDISDGVKWLIKTGVADPKKVCIYGGSYGGYATLAGITFSPELYACAIDYVGVSNLFTFMNTIPPYWKPYMDMMYEMVGNPEKEKDLMRAASPVFHVDKIRAPLFVAQGANDPRVNKAESDQIVDALRKRGVEVEYMVKDNEGHGFHNEENRFDFYRAMEKFLAKYLGGAS